MFKNVFLSWLVLASTLAGEFALADGVFVSSEELDLEEPNQIGLIVFDGQKEDLYLMVNFFEAQGKSLKKFGWILATPTEPKAEESSDEVFVELMDMTRPYYNEESPFGFGIGCMGGMDSGGLGGDKSGENDVIIEGVTVTGAYKITTVSSESAEPLRKWIKGRGFYIDAEADPVLDWYIKKNWRFLAIDVDLDEARREGNLKPLKLTFETKRAVFPLKISSINGIGKNKKAGYYKDKRGITEVLIYVVADTAVQVSNRTDVSEEFTASFTVDRLDAYPKLKQALLSSGVITKMRFWAAPDEMDDDVYFTKAPDTASFFVTKLAPKSRNTALYCFAALVLVMTVRLFRKKRA